MSSRLRGPSRIVALAGVVILVLLALTVAVSLSGFDRAAVERISRVSPVSV